MAVIPLVFSKLLNSPSQWKELPWQPFREGIEVYPLYGTPGSGPAAALLRYAPGAKNALHSHTGYEHVLILSGSQTDATGRQEAGTVIVNPPGSAHSIVSEQGCIALLIWEKPVEFAGH